MVHQLHQLEALFQHLAKRQSIGIKMVENSEFQHKELPRRFQALFCLSATNASKGLGEAMAINAGLQELRDASIAAKLVPLPADMASEIILKMTDDFGMAGVPLFAGRSMVNPAAPS
jgi:hypothetical protein